jgi:hypothetical protein
LKYSPFAEKAGMQKATEQQSSESLGNVSQALSNLGFDLQFLGSQRYVLEKLTKLSPMQTNVLKDAFIRNKHPRFKREANPGHQPFGKTEEYIRAIRDADLEKIAKLIKILGAIRQSKVYLFWSADFDSKSRQEKNLCVCKSKWRHKPVGQ